MQCLADVHAVLGEGPCWIVQDQSMLWVDINRPHIFQWNADRGLQTHMTSENICSIVPRRSGGYIGAGYNGLVTLSDDFTITRFGHPEAELAENRFNDGKSDREGRFWAGTMDHAEARDSGALYRIDYDLSWTTIDTGYRVTNGPAFSANGRTMYHTDSAIQCVYVFDLDAAGNATNRRPFLQFTPDMGYPDGMTVDAENCLWIAFWDGWCVRRFAPDGCLLETVSVPVQKPTSVAFGGPKMDRLFITSAARDLSDAERKGQPHAGGLFAFYPGVKGIAEVPFAG